MYTKKKEGGKQKSPARALNSDTVALQTIGKVQHPSDAFLQAGNLPLAPKLSISWGREEKCVQVLQATKLSAGPKIQFLKLDNKERTQQQVGN